MDAFAKATDDPAAVAKLIQLELSVVLATFPQVGDFEPIVDHCYALTKRLDAMLAEVPADRAVPLGAESSALADTYGSEFG